MSRIPKKIHYIWFGDKPLSELEERCIASWRKYLPDYEIIKWNESNFDVKKHPFTQKAFMEKKWAFLSDFARLQILYDYGGIYMDTDVEVLKPLDVFLEHDLFIGMESNTHINASILGSINEHWFLREILEEYTNLEEYTAIPVIMTKVLERYTKAENKLQTYKDITIYPSSVFYPLPFNEKFDKKMITSDTYTIHWWNYSWGSWKAQVLKKFGIFELVLKLKNKLSK